MSVLVNLPEDHREAWKNAAAAKGVTLSEWIRAACSEALPKRVRSNLSEPAPRGNPAFRERKKRAADD